MKPAKGIKDVILKKDRYAEMSYKIRWNRNPAYCFM
jgi:hypothetical protein